MVELCDFIGLTCCYLDLGNKTKPQNQKGKKESKGPNTTDSFETSSCLELSVENIATSSCVLSIFYNAEQEKMENNTLCLVVKYCS